MCQHWSVSPHKNVSFMRESVVFPAAGTVLGKETLEKFKQKSCNIKQDKLDREVDDAL